MNKKKIITACLVVALLAVFAIGGSLAYFTDTDTKDNTFTVGNVDIEITETDWNPEVDHIADPGVPVDKNPVVRNIGKNDAWIRVNVTISDATAFYNAMRKHGLNNLSDIFSGHDSSKWTLASKGDIVNDTLTYSYYYYKPLLAKNGDTIDATVSLFESVTIPAEFTSADMKEIGSDFTITVTADAIQANGFTDVEKAFSAFDTQKAAEAEAAE